MRPFKALATIVTNTAELNDAYGVSRREYAERCWHFDIPMKTITGLRAFTIEDPEICFWIN